MRQEFEEVRSASAVTVGAAASLVVQPEPAAVTGASRSVDRLLAMVRKRTRLQKVYRWLAAAIAAPPIALFLHNLFVWYYQVPLLVGYEQWLNPLFTRRTIERSSEIVDGNTVQIVANRAATDYVTPCILALVCFTLIALAYRQRARLTRELAEFDDVRSVGAFTDALALRGPARSAASNALTRLLPHLHASDAGLLNDAHRDRLRQEILRRNEALTIAILKSYEQVGDARDLSTVEKIARGTIRTSARVKDAAESCLPYLRHRVETATTLLRPAAEQTTNPPALLRPAAGRTPKLPESLLRPSDG